MKKIILLLLVLCLMGCQPIIKKYPRNAQFYEDEYNPYDKSGTGIIQGQAFLKTRGGDVKYGAGNIVTMNPVTSYSTEWFEFSVKKHIPLEEPDPRTLKYNRQTVADGEGRFEFNDLPAGEYYIACYISWEVPTSSSYMITTGGYAYAKVKVEEGKVIKVVVTR